MVPKAAFTEWPYSSSLIHLLSKYILLKKDMLKFFLIYTTIVFIILYIYIIIIYNIYQYSSYIGKYLLNQKCSKNIIIVKDYDNLKLLQYSVSHDPSEIILIF